MAKSLHPGVLVMNPGSYIGVNVLLDIGYAYAKEKPIYLTCPSSEPAVMSLVDRVVGEREQ